MKGTAANKRAGDNRKWQFIFGAILIVAIIAALIVMITVSLDNADNPNAPVMPTMSDEKTTGTIIILMRLMNIVPIGAIHHLMNGTASGPRTSPKMTDRFTA